MGPRILASRLRYGAVKIEPNNNINKSWDDPPIIQKSAVVVLPNPDTTSSG